MNTVHCTVEQSISVRKPFLFTTTDQREEDSEEMKWNDYAL